MRAEQSRTAQRWSDRREQPISATRYLVPASTPQRGERQPTPLLNDRGATVGPTSGSSCASRSLWWSFRLTGQPDDGQLGQLVEHGPGEATERQHGVVHDDGGDADRPGRDHPDDPGSGRCDRVVVTVRALPGKSNEQRPGHHRARVDDDVAGHALITPRMAVGQRAAHERRHLGQGEAQHVRASEPTRSMSAARSTDRSSKGRMTPPISWPCS